MLHINITWETFKTEESLGPAPDRFNQKLGTKVSGLLLLVLRLAEPQAKKVKGRRWAWPRYTYSHQHSGVCPGWTMDGVFRSLKIKGRIWFACWKHRKCRFIRWLFLNLWWPFPEEQELANVFLCFVFPRVRSKPNEEKFYINYTCLIWIRQLYELGTGCLKRCEFLS